MPSSSPSVSSSSSPGCTGRWITLSKYGQEQYTAGRTQGYRMVIEVDEVCNVSANIFLYQVSFPDPETGETTSRFKAVCSPSDIEQYPIDEPESGGTYYRLSSADLLFRAVSLADETWDAIRGDVEELVETLGLMDEMGLIETVTIDGLA